MSTFLDEPRRGDRTKSRSPLGDDSPPSRARDSGRGAVKSPKGYPKADDYDAHDEDDYPRKRSPRDDKPSRHDKKSRAPPRDDYRPSSDRGSEKRRPSPMENGFEDPPPRYKSRDPYDDPEPPRRKDNIRDYARENDSMRKPPRKYDDDSDEEPKPRSSRRNRDRSSDRGYRSDDHKKKPPRDDHDRGYRTDDRDKRDRRREKDRDRYADRDRRDRDRDRDRERDRRDRDRDRARSDEYDRRRDRDRYADRDRDRDRDRDYRGGSGRGKKEGPDFDRMMETGKKRWEQAAPVAKPLLGALAKAYLDKGGR